MEYKILVFGTSISWGAWDERGGWVDRLKVAMNKKTLEAGGTDWYSVYNLSISGDTSRGMLARFDRDVELRYSPLAEELIILFELGINDSQYLHTTDDFQVPKHEFKFNFEQLLAKAKKLTKNVIVVGAPAVVDARLDHVNWDGQEVFSYSSKDAKSYNAVITALQDEHSLTYVDIFFEFEKAGVASLMTEDGLHPNTAGHDVYYEEVMKQLEPLL